VMVSAFVCFKSKISLLTACIVFYSWNIIVPGKTFIAGTGKDHYGLRHTS
jgi:hypothetical protein